MKELLQSTVQLITILSIPIIFYAGVLLGAELNPDHESLSNSVIDVNLSLEEEKYIDDILFDTKEIAVEAKFRQAMSHQFELEDEASINDIPFDTYQIANYANHCFDIKN